MEDEEFLQAPREASGARATLISWILSHTGVRLPESSDTVRQPEPSVSLYTTYRGKCLCPRRVCRIAQPTKQQPTKESFEGAVIRADVPALAMTASTEQIAAHLCF